MFRRKTPLATVALVASWLSIAEAQAPAATVPSGAPLTIDQAVREALDRNQGEIARAQLQQAQLRARVQAAETDIASELTTAYAEYAAAHEIVDTIEAQMLGRRRTSERPRNTPIGEAKPRSSSSWTRFARQRHDAGLQRGPRRVCAKPVCP